LGFLKYLWSRQGKFYCVGIFSPPKLSAVEKEVLRWQPNNYDCIMDNKLRTLFYPSVPSLLVPSLKICSVWTNRSGGKGSYFLAIGNFLEYFAHKFLNLGLKDWGLESADKATLYLYDIQYTICPLFIIDELPQHLFWWSKDSNSVVTEKHKQTILVGCPMSTRDLSLSAARQKILGWKSIVLCNL
jgi:hypothetical protein